MFLQCGQFKLSLERPLIMGILNITPDSFSHDGLLAKPDAAFEYAMQLMEDGADLLDIGGESTRPGATPVSADEEIARVMPILELLVSRNIPVSIDTQKPVVMQAAIGAGAAMINDVNALQAEGALDIIANSSVAVCLMHKQGNPQTMQMSPQYQDVVSEVAMSLRSCIDRALEANIALDRITIDPGFGFGKSIEHNLDMLAHLSDFKALGVPLLVGLSRKSMLGQITGRSVHERLSASVAAAVLSVMKGANIVRVHDVKATKDALAVVRAVEGAL